MPPPPLFPARSKRGGVPRGPSLCPKRNPTPGEVAFFGVGCGQAPGKAPGPGAPRRFPLPNPPARAPGSGPPSVAPPGGPSPAPPRGPRGEKGFSPPLPGPPSGSPPLGSPGGGRAPLGAFLARVPRGAGNPARIFLPPRRPPFPPGRAPGPLSRGAPPGFFPRPVGGGVKNKRRRLPPPQPRGPF